MLRSTTNDTEGTPQRRSPGVEPGYTHSTAAQAASLSSAASEDELGGTTHPVPLRPRSSNTLRGSGPSGATPTLGQSPDFAPPPREATGANQIPIRVAPAAEGLQASVQRLLEALNEAELAAAPESELEIRRRQFDRAVQALRLTQAGSAPAPSRSAYDEAGKIIGVLNKIQPKPKLGVENKPPTPQQVDQWIKDVDTAIQYVQVLDDSITRTHWIMGTIQYGIHRELIQSRITEGSIRTWADLQAEEERLVQDPILTRYENYSKFFNFEWRDNDSVNTFLMQLSRRESLLPHSFFKFEDGGDDHELKIAFVWARTPQVIQREIQRNGTLEHIREWPDFERALRNAETATSTKTGSKKTEPSGKRPAGSPPRRNFKRHHNKGEAATRNESGNAPAQNRSQSRDRGNQPRNSKENGYQKPHWKNNRENKSQDSKPSEPGKGKP